MRDVARRAALALTLLTGVLGCSSPTAPAALQQPPTQSPAPGGSQPAVACVVSDWSAWPEWSAWVPNADDTQETRSRTRTRTVITPASNGGTACPPLADTETETRDIDSPPPPPPPPPPPGPTRFELWGRALGSSIFNVFLGCFSCSQFASDSVFNQFSPYGSEFSQTSIWNEFGPYGSEFQTTSACNPFATAPPRLVNTATNTYTELTLNEFRPFAERNPTVVAILTAICN